MPRKFLSTFLSHLPFNLQPHATQRPFSYLLAPTPPCKQCAAPNQTPLDAAICHDAPPSTIRSHLSDIGSTTARNSAPALGRPHAGADPKHADWLYWRTPQTCDESMASGPRAAAHGAQSCWFEPCTQATGTYSMAMTAKATFLLCQQGGIEKRILKPTASWSRRWRCWCLVQLCLTMDGEICSYFTHSIWRQ
jgi:hypothetical protein